MKIKKLHEKKVEEPKVLIQQISQTNKFLRNIINIIIFLGAFGFLIIGISSYIKTDLIWFLKSEKIIFFPQGLTMFIYGTLGILLSINQILITFFDVGNGYNEFNKEKNYIELYRKGYPIKKNDIKINYLLIDIVRNKNLEFKTT
jgi:hypothetical protein